MGDAIMANAIWIKFKFMVWTFFYGCQFSALQRAFWRKMFMRNEDEEGELFRTQIFDDGKNSNDPDPMLNALRFTAFHLLLLLLI